MANDQCGNKWCACPDYEILSGGGDLLKLPEGMTPEEADQAIKKFLDRLK